MAEIDPGARLAIAQIRTLAYALEAVVQDLGAAGLHTLAIRAQIETLLQSAAAIEASERQLAASGGSGDPS